MNFLPKTQITTSWKTFYVHWNHKTKFADGAEDHTGKCLSKEPWWKLRIEVYSKLFLTNPKSLSEPIWVIPKKVFYLVCGKTVETESVSTRTKFSIWMNSKTDWSNLNVTEFEWPYSFGLKICIGPVFIKRDTKRFSDWFKMIRNSSKTDSGMDRNRSDSLRTNFNPILSPRKQDILRNGNFDIPRYLWDDFGTLKGPTQKKKAIKFWISHVAHLNVLKSSYKHPGISREI